MKEWIIFLMVILPCMVVAQTAPDTYLIFFTDKDNTPYTLEQPEQFLSERAIQRRITQGIALDDLDLPVDPVYVSTVLQQGEVQLLTRSKWFNAVTILTMDQEALDLIAALPFVQQVRSTRSGIQDTRQPEKFPVGDAQRELEYGASFTQVSMMNGHLLHDLAQGEGMLIGVLDSGFDGVDWMPAFDPLRERNGIVLSRDMVVPDGNVFQSHWHGRSVLSCMGAILEDQLIGTAPQADYVLVRTEDAETEYIVEEDNWVAGAELCDSLGCDILNTSLGYTRFDDPSMDHSYADMDGNTTRISIAAGIASRKGMIPVTSVGNSGQSDWFYLSAPADAIDILAVGAVGDMAQYAPFSSHGPSADGRIKPDVTAMGWGTIGLSDDGVSVQPINGTSFSSPLVAGLVACLWQLHPQRTNLDIMDAVRRSASQFATPDDSLGHGIPNFMLAHELLVLSTSVPEHASAGLRIFPVPFQDRLEIRLEQEGLMDVALFDLSGRAVWTVRSIQAQGGRLLLADPSFGSLGAGSYVITVTSPGRRLTGKVVKVD